MLNIGPTPNVSFACKHEFLIGKIQEGTEIQRALETAFEETGLRIKNVQVVEIPPQNGLSHKVIVDVPDSEKMGDFLYWVGSLTKANMRNAGIKKFHPPDILS